MHFEAIERFWQAIRDRLAVLPDPAVGLLLVAAAVLLALAAHVAVVMVVRRTTTGHPFARSLLTPLEGPLRLALVLFTLNFAVAAAPIGLQLSTVLLRGLQLAFIALVGWMALSASSIGADLYLRRFNIDVADNLLARKHVTQVRVLKGTLNTLIVVMTVAAALMTFEQVRQYGVSLVASAGIAGIVIGLAARPMLSNLIAGIQLAITQPIRIEDAVIVENEWGWVEEITSTYVVVRLWDLRRMIVPLTYFIEKPFQNWTRESGALLGSVLIRADYTVPVEEVRRRLKEIVESTPLWDGRVVALQVTDADDQTVELRALASGRTAPATFDLRCLVREKLIEFLVKEHPRALPHRRHDAVEGAAVLASPQAERLWPQERAQRGH
jgi:small-conductance mechanosensitive channel